MPNTRGFHSPLHFITQRPIDIFLWFIDLKSWQMQVVFPMFLHFTTPPHNGVEGQCQILVVFHSLELIIQ